MKGLCYLLTIGMGLILGSFFNVVIYRVPRRIGMGGRSHCPECDSQIAWYDNLPVLSYLALRARCRNCGQRIPVRYPLVEAATAGLFAFIYWWSTAVMPETLGLSGHDASRDLHPELFIGLVLVAVLVVATGTDLTDRIIPNVVLLAGGLLTLPLVIFSAIYRGEPGRITISIASGITGAAFFIVLGLLYEVVHRDRGDEAASPELMPPQEGDDAPVFRGIGMGDIKLTLFTGIPLGYFCWYLQAIAVFIAAFFGVIVSVPLLLAAGASGKTRIPFGPFLALGAVIALVWGPGLYDWYSGLLT